MSMSKRRGCYRRDAVCYRYAPDRGSIDLDLAPADGSDCGEQRVIYSLEPGSPLTTVPFQDFTLIFEARYPNPDAR